MFPFQDASNKITRLDHNQKVNRLILIQNRIRVIDPTFSPQFTYEPIATQTLSGEATNPDLWKILHVSPELEQSLEQVSGYISLVAKVASTVTGGIDFANSALKLLGLVPGPEDQFAILFNKIKVEIQKVHTAVIDASMLQTMSDIDTSYAKAKSAAQSITAWVSGGKPTGNTALWEGAKNADTFSRQALQELMTPSRWLRLYDVSVYKTNGHHADDSFGQGPWWAYLMTHPWSLSNWNQDLERMSELVPREPGDFVWDYRYVLPAYLYAVCTRLTVLQALYPNFQTINQSFLDEINAMAAFLKGINEKLYKGIWNLNLEHWQGLNSASITCPVFVADIYTGQFSTGQMLKDYNLLTKDPTNYGPLMFSRFLDIQNVAIVPVLSAIADLSEISNIKTNSSSPVVEVPVETKTFYSKFAGVTEAIFSEEVSQLIFADNASMFQIHVGIEQTKGLRLTKAYAYNKKNNGIGFITAFTGIMESVVDTYTKFITPRSEYDFEKKVEEYMVKPTPMYLIHLDCFWYAPEKMFYWLGVQRESTVKTKYFISIRKQDLSKLILTEQKNDYSLKQITSHTNKGTQYWSVIFEEGKKKQDYIIEVDFKGIKARHEYNSNKKMQLIDVSIVTDANNIQKFTGIWQEGSTKENYLFYKIQACL